MCVLHCLQGGGKRKGAFAIYIEPWHADIFDFLDLRKNHGKEENRARDLFYGLWLNDLFMQRVEDNTDWSLFCPNEAPGLAEVWGAEFEELYTRYEWLAATPQVSTCFGRMPALAAVSLVALRCSVGRQLVLVWPLCDLALATRPACLLL